MAADSLSVITAGLARGLQDGVLGVFKLYTLDKQENLNKPKLPEPPRSTLARRRLESMKEEMKKPTEVKETEPKVIHRILRCCAWNGGIFWLSIILFDYILMPFLQYLTFIVFQGSPNKNIVWSMIGPVLSWTFSALWVLPLFVLSKVVNGLWFQGIADAAYRQSRGRPMMMQSLGKMLADILFSIILQLLFLIQGNLARFIPIRGIGDLVSIVHFALLYAVYAFEYKWYNMGWEVHKRLLYVETNWPYFVGFGLPLAVLTELQSSFVMSGCVFSLLFPLFIISANEAESIAGLQCPFPLLLFSAVTKITNQICTVVLRLIGSRHHVVGRTDQPAPTDSPAKPRSSTTE